jgi:hypothetical protein
MSLQPPPELAYSSFDAAYDAALAWARDQGYGFTRLRSKPDGAVLKTRHYYQCDRHSYHEPRALRRRTSSRSCGCKFSFNIRQFNGDRTSHSNDAVWTIRIQEPAHNHGPSSSPAAHFCHRKLEPGMLELVTSMSSSGSTPKQVMAALLQKDRNISTTLLDIYNAREQAQKRYLMDQTPIQALIQELKDDNEWVIEYELDQQQRVKALFFAHAKQVEIMKASPDVLIMDCTYRTNRYNMPLLHIGSVSAIQKSFSAAFCFLSGETHLDYLWAIQRFHSLVFHGLIAQVIITDNDSGLKSACRDVFPITSQLLCVWHVQKNVLTKAKEIWRESEAEDKDQLQEVKELREDFMAAWNLVRRLHNIKTIGTC